MVENTSKLEGGYTIEHGGTDTEVGTLLPEGFIKTDDLPKGLKKIQAKVKKKISENIEPVLDKPKVILPKKEPKPRAITIIPKHRAILARVEKGEKISKAMIAMSYSNKVRNVTTLTKTKSWQALMQEHLPEDLIALRHSELLNKRARRNIKNAKGDVIEYDVDDGPDTPSVVKALELAYKLRGSFAAEKPSDPSKVIYNLFYKPEVREAMQSFEDQLKQQIKDEADSTIKNAVYSEAPDDGGNGEEK